MAQALNDTISIDYSNNSSGDVLNPADLLRSGQSKQSVKTIGEQPSSLQDIVGMEQTKESLAVNNSNKELTYDKMDNLNKAKVATAALDSLADISNAQNKYSAISEANKTNIFNTMMEAAQVREGGYLQGIYARTAAQQVADTSLLSMAAQGQDVNAAANRKVSSSYEAMGIYNQMQQEVNGMRQALGLEMKAFEYQKETNAAKFQRDMTILTSVGKLGASFI